jgi:uncharacterized DUF497 family protein
LQYNVEWDPEKARINFKKHGISFELASSVFFDPRAVTIFDHEHGESEDRWITLGMTHAPDFGHSKNQTYFLS